MANFTEFQRIFANFACGEPSFHGIALAPFAVVVKAKIFFVLALALGGAYVHAVQWRGRPAAVDCAKLLEFGVSALASKPDPIVFAGTFQEMRALMLESGYPRPFTDEVVGLIQHALKTSTDSGNILTQIARHLMVAGTDENQLLLCVTADCKIGGSTAAHIAVPLDFEIAPFRWGSVASEKPGWSGRSGPQAQPPPRTIFLTHGAYDVSLLWASKFIHEAAHFSDFLLIKEWIDANILLLQQHEMPDERFVEFVRVKAGRSVVDEGFMRVFLEARAYQAQDLGFRRIVPNHIYSVMRTTARRAAVDDIKDFRGVTGYLIERFALSENNVFEIGERLALEMRGTISRAKRISTAPK